MRFINSVIVILILLIAAVSTPSFAKSNLIEQAHKFVSKGVSNLARNLDSVIGGRKAWEEENKTYIEFTHEMYGGEISNFSQFTYRVRLRIPQTNKKLHLFLERQKETLFEPTSKERNFAQNEPQRRRRIGLRFDHFTTKHFFAAFKTGIRFDGFDLKKMDGFAEYRIRYQNNLSESLDFESSLTPSYYINEHLEYESDTHLDYRPLQRWLFRLTNGSSWRQTDKIFQLSQGISGSYQYSAKKTVSLALSINSDTSPDHLPGTSPNHSSAPGLHAQTYQIAANYGQPLFWDWIIIGLNANLLFDRARNFSREFGVGASLSIRTGQ